MTKRESAIVSAFTGIMCGSFSDLHEYAEELFGRPIQTIEFSVDGVVELLKEKSKEDFINLEIKP